MAASQPTPPLPPLTPYLLSERLDPPLLLYHSVEKQRDSRSQLKKGFIFEGTLITDILSLDLQHYSCRKHVCAPFRK